MIMFNDPSRMKAQVIPLHFNSSLMRHRGVEGKESRVEAGQFRSMIDQTSEIISLSAVQPGKPLLLLISHLDDLDLSSFTYGSFREAF